jgi:hypothetical protein
MDVEPHVLWWALLESRIAQVSSRFPKDLIGAVGFEIDELGIGGPRYRIEVDGPRVTTSFGTTGPLDALAATSDVLLGRLLFGEAPPAQVFQVFGDYALYRRLFECLSQHGAPRSWLEMRIER